VTRGPAALPADELHIWRASLDQAAPVVSSLARLLSPEERERAARFLRDRLRDRYVVARGLLRTLLGRYVAAPPEHLEFSYGEHGKPYLTGEGPRFNLSHSGPVALFAFSSSAEVGVDVELVERSVTLDIAERFFSPSEVQSLRAVPGPLQPHAFLACWTRKEAFIKARGDGLTLPLNSFDVTLAPGAPAALLRTAWSESEPGEWRLEDLSDPAAGVVAAVAVRRRDWRVVPRDVAEIGVPVACAGDVQ
jgi:4'-phosphopantetheinyl transferase